MKESLMSSVLSATDLRNRSLRKSPPDLEEIGLVRSLVAGDHAALGELYDRYNKPLFSLCMRLLQDSEESEEVIQDVFTSLWKKANTFDFTRSKLFTWLTVLTRNKCIDRIRSRNRRIPRAYLSDDQGEKLSEPSDERTALDDLYDGERVSAVRSAIETLPGEQKRAIHLAFIQGMTHEQIAEDLDLPLGTVKSRIRYGLGKLKSVLPELLNPEQRF